MDEPVTAQAATIVAISMRFQLEQRSFMKLCVAHVSVMFDKQHGGVGSKAHVLYVSSSCNKQHSGVAVEVIRQLSLLHGPNQGCWGSALLL